MRDDNTEPRDNQQIADDSQQSGTAGQRDVNEQVSNRGVEEGLDEEDAEEEDEFTDDDDDGSVD
jgi:hypothetical protein